MMMFSWLTWKGDCNLYYVTRLSWVHWSMWCSVITVSLWFTQESTLIHLVRRLWKMVYLQWKCTTLEESDLHLLQAPHWSDTHKHACFSIIQKPWNRGYEQRRKTPTCIYHVPSLSIFMNGMSSQLQTKVSHQHVQAERQHHQLYLRVNNTPLCTSVLSHLTQDYAGGHALFALILSTHFVILNLPSQLFPECNVPGKTYEVRISRN